MFHKASKQEPREDLPQIPFNNIDFIPSNLGTKQFCWSSIFVRSDSIPIPYSAWYTSGRIFSK